MGLSKRKVDGMVSDSRNRERKLVEEVQTLRSQLAELKGAEVERKRAEEALRSAHRELKATFDAIQENINVVDIEFNLIDINKTMIKTFGLPSRESVIGHKCFEVLKGLKDICPGCAVAEVYQTKAPAYRVTTPEDELSTGGKSFEIFVYPIMDECGKLCGAIEFARDITKRKRAEEMLQESEEEFRLTFENAKDAIFWANLETGLITNCNKAAETLLEKKREEIVGSHQTALHPPQKAEHYTNMFKEHVEQKGVADDEAEVITKSGKIKPVHITASITLVGKKPIIQGIFRDITERKKGEEKLLEYQEQLRLLSSELALAEERQRRRIATDLHDHISQALALSVMRLQTLRESAGSVDAQQLDEICETISHTIEDVSCLTFGLSSPTLYKFGLEAAVAELLDDQLRRRHGIACEFSDDREPKPLDDDIRVVLFQSVRELLINIIKHAQAHKVLVAIQRDGDSIRITISDDGVGFDVEQVGPSTRQSGGFGLFNIRERLDYIGGSLEIQSEAGSGSWFTLIAPLKTGADSPGEEHDGSKNSTG